MTEQRRERDRERAVHRQHDRTSKNEQSVKHTLGRKHAGKDKKSPPEGVIVSCPWLAFFGIDGLGL